MFKSKILIVDDSATIRKIMVKILQDIGYTQILSASSAEMALEQLQGSCLLGQKRIDLVISDWEMGEMSGLDLLSHMRADVELASIPFIMVTSIAHEKGIIPALQAGVTGYIEKPFNQTVIQEKIASILKRKMAPVEKK